MIDHVTGVISAVRDKTLVVDVGFFGLSITVANIALFQIGDMQKLYLHIHWNQEQGAYFYGFVNQYEREIFLLIVGCSGVGPKIALAILSTIGPVVFINAIQQEDSKTLAQVPGIGIKKAEQIIVYLKHKITDVLVHNTGESIAKSSNDWHSVTQALESLHYSRAEINAAIQYARNKQQDKEQHSFDIRLRHALSFLAKQI